MGQYNGYFMAFSFLGREKKRKKEEARRWGGGVMAGDAVGELEPGRGMTGEAMRRAAAWLKVCRRS